MVLLLCPPMASTGRVNITTGKNTEKNARRRVHPAALLASHPPVRASGLTTICGVPRATVCGCSRRRHMTARFDNDQTRTRNAVGHLLVERDGYDLVLPAAQYQCRAIYPVQKRAAVYAVDNGLLLTDKGLRSYIHGHLFHHFHDRPVIQTRRMDQPVAAGRQQPRANRFGQAASVSGELRSSAVYRAVRWYRAARGRTRARVPAA